MYFLLEKKNLYNFILIHLKILMKLMTLWGNINSTDLLNNKVKKLKLPRMAFSSLLCTFLLHNRLEAKAGVKSGYGEKATFCSPAQQTRILYWNLTPNLAHHKVLQSCL